MSRRNRLLAVALAVLLAAPALPGAGVAAAQDGGEVTFDYEGETLTLEAGPGQVVSGQADLPAGTTTTVRLRATSENPFLIPADATVDSDGRFRATFDLSDVAAGTEFTAAVSSDSDASVDGEVVECDEACEQGDEAANATTFDGTDGELTLGAGPGRALHGESDLPAGTTVSVRVQSQGSNPFLQTVEATVGADGRFRAVADLSGVTAGTEFTALAHHDGTELASVNGTVVECETDCQPPGDEGGDGPTANRSTPTGDELAVQSVATVEQGETARVTVGLGDADEATLSVGGPSVNYVANVTVSDGNGDGLVTVLFDTAAAGGDGQTALAADGEDAVVVRAGEETDLGADRWSLAAGEYPTALYRGDQATGESVDAGTLIITEGERPDDGRATTTTWRGETSEFGLDDGIVRGDRGETVRIPVGLGDAGAGTLVLGGPDVGWQVNATVRDGDDDDSGVVVLLDTSNVDEPGSALSVADEADSVSVETEIEASDGALDAGDYPMTLYVGTQADGSGEDVATFILERAPATDAGTDDVPTASPGDGSSTLGTVGLIGAGGVLAVVGIGLLLGVFRR